MGQRSLPVHCLSWGVPALKPTGCLVRLMVASRGVTWMSNSQDWCCQGICSSNEPPDTPHLWVVSTHDFVYAFQRQSFCLRPLPTPHPEEVLQLNPTSKPDSLGSLPPVARYPHTGQPGIGLRTFIPVGELLCCNCYPVCGLLIQWVYDLILSQLCPSKHLMWFLLCLWV